MHDVYCPRCGGPIVRRRRSLMCERPTIEVCGPCGRDEARRRSAGESPIPPHDWPITRTDEPTGLRRLWR